MDDEPLGQFHHCSNGDQRWTYQFAFAPQFKLQATMVPTSLDHLAVQEAERFECNHGSYPLISLSPLCGCQCAMPNENVTMIVGLVLISNNLRAIHIVLANTKKR